MTDKPAVLFVCFHNYGRSQMAAGYMSALSDGAVELRSGGSEPGTETMGCGDLCPIFPGKRDEDWELDDPKGKDIADMRPIRDHIKRRIQALIAELLP